ncbi:hypothetical protein DYI37_03865 [Fulvimarina endophytica]|uniref:Uncharacterized protein n=1 Tax=Fulvimarina endophytica TaxID=2293836 RepID=A0A371X6Z6_9HYPH|nr:hypothetical protein [Fulvimarina endophytica]RFC65012.1 hypothetical protein DYI37_03865 [Fulvimarina endophytica]
MTVQGQEPNAAVEPEAVEPEAVEIDDTDALWDEFDASEGLTTADPDADAAADGFGADAEDDLPADGDGEPQATADEVGAVEHTATAEAAVQDLDWSGVPETHRAAFEQMRADNAKLAQKERSANGRYTATQRRYDELVKAAQPRQPASGDRPTLETSLASLKEDYPEIAGPLQQALAAVQGDVATLAEAEEGRRSAAQTELSEFLQTEADEFSQQHPDFEEVVRQDAGRFTAWVDDQPKAVRDAFARNAQTIVNAAEASNVASLYKAFLGMGEAAAAAATQTGKPSLDARRQRQLQSTANPSRASRRPASSGIPEEGDRDEIWDAFERAEAAQAAAR